MALSLLGACHQPPRVACRSVLNITRLGRRLGFPSLVMALHFGRQHCHFAAFGIVADLLSIDMEISGGDKLEKALADIAKKMSGGSVRAGFLEGATYPDGISVAQVAFWDEFGTSKSPARPFFRTTISNNSGEWAEKVEKAVVHYDYDSKKVLNFMGEIIKEDIQTSINGWTTPANAESTIAKKGFDAPLRHTMHMHDSVGHEVEE